MMTETELVVPRAPETSNVRPDASSTPAQKVAAHPSALPRPRLLARAPPGHRPQSHSYPGTCNFYQDIAGAPRVCVMDPEGVPKEDTRAGDFVGLRFPAGSLGQAPRDSDCVLSYVHTNGSIAYPQHKHSCDTMNPNVRINIDDGDAFPPGPLRSSDSWDSFSTSPGSSENGDSVSSGSRGEEFSEDSEGDGFVDCGHDNFPFCQCLNEKAGGPPGLQCDHEEFPFCDCLARAAEMKHKKTLGYRPPRGEGRRRRGYIGPSLSAFRDAGLEVFDETEESDFQESETETGTPQGRHSDGETDTEGAGAESEVEGAVGYNGKESDEVAGSVGLLAPPGQPLRRASIVTCDSRRASIVTSPDPVKIAVFGTDGVGKSALIVRLLTGRFIGEYDPTMEAVYSYQFPLEGYDLPLQVMDTAGHVDVVEAGREAQVSWGEGFMLVFSLTSHSSFAALSRLRRVILELTPGAPRPMVLVGNKADLSHAREVNPDEIRDLVDCWGCDYFEVAAPEPWDVVVRPFTALYQAVLESRGT
ncbi:uncharacterized protein LOC125046114 [Penaeus chinensis]|uniref:uncharacterized protein LOC125046114 n=1 Tax=Penaeus chinensis TaxID=139456 RepID=UPI001FB7B6B5|nr:uncharacterized protein LOC125046114 [Penaeus chinensis]XP_047499714.1 uncharacterized protein LOC125046114 [Penaeus chinensis]